MKLQANPFLLVSAVFSVTATAHAAPLLTDNFDVANYDASTFNNNLATTQGAPFAPITYSVFAPGGGYTAQHSNGGNMIVVGNGGIPGGRASLNRNFAIEANYADKPLSVSFNLDEVSDPGDPSVWGHFGLGSSQNGDFFGTDFAMFFRSNGQWQTRDNNPPADLGTGSYADGDLITFVFSNTAGTGSAFNGNGSKVTITVGAAAPVTYTLAQLTVADGFLTWGGFTYGAFSVMAIDNLSVDMDATFPAGEGFVWSGAVNANWDETTANWSNVNLFTKWFNHPGTPNNAVFDATGSAQPNVTLALSRPLEVGTLTFDTAGYTLSGSATLGESTNIVTNANATISAALNGGVSLTKSGLSTLTLTASNSYSGSTTINQGTLEITSTGKIYGAGYTNSPVVTVANGTTLRVNNWNYDAPGSLGALDFARERLVVNGGTIEHAGNSNDNGGAAGRNLTVGTGGATLKSTTAGQIWTIVENGIYGPLINDNGLTLGGAGDGVIGKAITGIGSLTKTDSGTWSLTGANTYTGNTTVDGGTLSLSSPSLDNASSVIIGTTPGATMNLNFTGYDIVSGLQINGSGPLPAGAYNSSHPTYGSYFTGSGTLVVAPAGNGTWTSLVDGNWENPANWLAGTVAYGADSTATFNAASGATVTLAGPLTIGNLAFDTSDYTLAGAALTLDAAGTPTINVGAGRSATVSANVAGSFGLEKTGAGTLVLAGVKSYTGGTIVTGGTLEIAGANSGNATIHGSVFVDTGATLTFTGGDGTGFGYFNNPVTSITVDGGTINAVSGSHLGFGPFMTMILDNGGSLQGSWQWNGDGLLAFSSYGDVTNTISGSVTLRPDNSANHTFFVDDGASATDLQVDANLSDFWPAQSWGRSGLVKAGPGTMVLSGNNTYDSNTVVNDGLLEVSPSSGLRFLPEGNGINNSVSGSGSGSLSFLGTVDLDLGIANTTAGNVWNLFNLASFSTAPDLSGIAGVTSTLGAFTEVSPGVWELAVTGAKWVFTESNGNLAYVIATNDYENWGALYGLAAGSEAGDLDNDGLTNEEEYAFGLIPNSGSSVNPIVVPFDKTTGTFSYTRRATPTSTGLSYTVWTSTDLGTWTQDTGATEGTITTSGEVQTVPVTISPSLLSNPRLFIQVRAD
ncbi:MAG: autotransporter-associated beta strand repeat-containing protein [Akkermansiaceae bacterium]|nr:autotransporter-associated beta strand repeat-containing protein [Akkermansiaceae bacterium]